MSDVKPARSGYVDTIKGLIIGGVIVAHAGMTYGLIGAWPYRETTIQPLSLPVAATFGAAVTVGMGVLFLIAGLFTPAAAERKGARRFFAGRVRRLGIPTILYLLIAMPLLNFIGHYASGASPSAAALFALERLRQLDVGPTWFLLALLLFTALYLANRAAGRRPRLTGAISMRDLLLLAILSGAGMAAVRVVQPATDLAPINLTVWPLDLALFALGAAAGKGWLEQVPRRAVGHAAGLMAAGVAVLAPLAVISSSDVAELAGGWHWQSAVFSLGESLFTIGVVVVVLRQFQRLATSPLRRYTRASFTAYLIQAPVVLFLGIGLRPWALAYELKFVMLAILSLVVCFGLATAFEESRHSQPGARLEAVPRKPRARRLSDGP